MNNRRKILKATINVRVTTTLKRKLIKMAKVKSIDVAELVREVLIDYVDKNE